MSDNQTDMPEHIVDLHFSSLPDTEMLAPITIGERIDVMDILRGLALVGILLMNIEWFNRAISGLGSQDTSLTGLDHAVGWLIRCFVEGKFYTIFSLLFGMGFAVMLLRAKAADRPFGAWFLRRMIILIIFGILHMVFLWGGDILHSYGFAGILLLGWVTLLKKERFKKYDNPKSFLKLSVIWLSVPIFFSVIAGISFGILEDTDELTTRWHEEIMVADRVESIQLKNEAEMLGTESSMTKIKMLDDKLATEQLDPLLEQTTTKSAKETVGLNEFSSEELIEQQAQAIVAQQREMAADKAEEVAAFTQNNYWRATAFRLDFSFFMLMFSVPFAFTMLLPIFILGYWLISSGIMKNYRQYSSAFKTAAWVGVSLGAVMEVGGLLVTQHPVSSQVMLLQGVGETLFFIGQFVMTIGYFGLIMRLLTQDKWHECLSVFSPMGRMALTNYISHSVILTSIFYGYAGGYFGEISRAPQMLLVLAIITFQLLFSRWWLNNYAFGPLEWLWRCLSYKKLQPMRIK